MRIRVTDAKIEAWIDDRQIVDQSREGRKFSVRSEVELSRPWESPHGKPRAPSAMCVWRIDPAK